MRKQLLFDSHNHTTNSHDGKSTADALCLSAIERGLSGIAFTDHCDIEYYKDIKSFDNIVNSVKEARNMNEKLQGELSVFAGVEMGEGIWNREAADALGKLCDFDVVLSSVHAVRCDKFDMPFSRIDFSEWTDQMITEYMRQYFVDMQEMVDTLDFDILTHLTVPLDYIKGRYGKACELEPHTSAIEGILKSIIRRDVSLEINTATLSSALNDTLPNTSIVKMYRDLGGKYITLASDSHTPERVGRHLDRVLDMIKELGYNSYCYYQGRERKNVEILEK